EGAYGGAGRRPGGPTTRPRSSGTGPPFAARPTGSAGVLPFTEPTAPQASFCSPCTPASAPDRLTNMSSRGPQARRWCRHDRRTAARLPWTAGAHRTHLYSGAVVAVAAHSATATPY